MESLRGRKIELRKQIYSLQSSLSQKEEDFENKNIISKIEILDAYKNAKYIMAYWPMENEVDITELIKRDKTKVWVLPSIEDGILVLKRYKGEENLIVSNYYGILEPFGDAEDLHKLIDLVIVPGVAFNSRGERIGHGKGYYDNLLPKLSNSYKVGVGFSYQEYADIPIDKHDFILDKVIFGMK